MHQLPSCVIVLHAGVLACTTHFRILYISGPGDCKSCSVLQTHPDLHSCMLIDTFYERLAAKCLLNLQMRGIKLDLYLHCSNMAVEAAAALQMHSVTRGSRLMPYVGNIRPNGLVELAKYMQQEQASVTSTHSAPLDGGLHAKVSPEIAEQSSDCESQGSSVDFLIIRTADSAPAESEQAQSDDQIARVLHNLDPVLVARLRLRARLHLEVLRVMDWCFFMLGTDCEQQSLHASHQTI